MKDTLRFLRSLPLSGLPHMTWMLPNHLGQECPTEVSSPQTTHDLSTIEVTDYDALTGGVTCGNLLRPGSTSSDTWYL